MICSRKYKDDLEDFEQLVGLPLKINPSHLIEKLCQQGLYNNNEENFRTLFQNAQKTMEKFFNENMSHNGSL